MKSFYAPASLPAIMRENDSARAFGVSSPPGPALHMGARARIAVYDAPSAAPRVEEVEPAPTGEFIETLATRTYELCRAAGGSVPYTVVREVAENLIHADFAEPVISILDGGETLRFADQGPGIPDKEQATRPGFTTANGEMKRHIRGVGSGLPIVREYLTHSGGSLLIEDNLGRGSVITINTGASGGTTTYAEERSFVPQQRAVSVGPTPLAPNTRIKERDVPAESDSLWTAGGVSSFREPVGSQSAFGPEVPPVAAPRLSTRQKQVLALVLESGDAGPSLVAKELGVGISTAYRDLATLEEAGLVSAVGGKRTLTSEGLSYLDSLMTR